MKNEVDTLTSHQQPLSCITHSLGFSNVVLLSNHSSGESQVVFELREVWHFDWGKDGRGAGDRFWLCRGQGGLEPEIAVFFVE